MPAKKRRIAIMLDLRWPYKRHSGVYAGTQQYAREQGWYSIIDEFAHDTLVPLRVKGVPYDGIIARVNHALYKQAARLKLPLVNVWASSPVSDKLPSVYGDFEAAGRQSAEHLLSRGLRNFAALTPAKAAAQEAAVRGFRREVREAGFGCAWASFPQNPWRDVANWRKAEAAMQRSVESWQPAIGVYISDEGMGRLLVQACHRRGLRVPEDVAIISCHNEETLCEHQRPALTAMEFGYERVGYEAARLLHALMDGGPPPDKPVLVPPIGLVVRESTDFFAIDNETVAAALAYISANSHRPIGQHDVAKALRIGTRTLQNRFRKYLGRPVVAEIRRVRIERAKRELARSKRPLAAIARDVGFGEAMRMYEVFRRELGITPSGYRKQRRMELESHNMGK